MNANVTTEANSLLFKTADILQMTLFEIETQVRGFVTRTFSVGGLWNLKSDVTVAVDEHSSKLVTAHMRVRKNLWAYVVVSSGGQWLLFYDGDRVKIKVGAESALGTGDGARTLAKLKPAINAAYVYSDAGWTPANVAALLEGMA